MIGNGKAEFIRCPICQGRVRIAEATIEDGKMDVQVVVSDAQQHYEMHLNCTCRYVEASGDRISEVGCPAHGGVV